MEKKRLLYASPFNPMKSGISDYSEILVKLLAKRFEVSLFVDDYELENLDIFQSYEIVRMKELPSKIDTYDYRIYNIGNNPTYHSYIYDLCIEYPGLIILHDVCLYFLFVGVHQMKNDLFSSIYKYEGLEIFGKAKNHEKRGECFELTNGKLAETYFFNREILVSNNKIMVHSDYAKHLVQETVPDVRIRKINMIPQISEQYTIVDKNTLFRKYGVPCDKLIVTSFGFISDTKQNLQVAKCIHELVKKGGYGICYVMVGEGNAADAYLEDNVIIKTGYTDLNEFNSFIDYSDLVVNLRYPSRGETSGAMIRVMSRGKASIVSNNGWFSEIPDECVVKIPSEHMEQDLMKQLAQLIEDEPLRKQLGESAKTYMSNEYDAERIVNSIESFLNE